jgi:hypothetical protein
MYTKNKRNETWPRSRDREKELFQHSHLIMDLMEHFFCFFSGFALPLLRFVSMYLPFPRTGWKTAESEIRCVFIFHNKSGMINSTMKNMFIYSQNMASSDLIFKLFHDIRTCSVKVELN